MNRISVDTKVISKIMELLLFPELAKFAHKRDLKPEAPLPVEGEKQLALFQRRQNYSTSLE